MFSLGLWPINKAALYRVLSRKESEAGFLVRKIKTYKKFKKLSEIGPVAFHYAESQSPEFQ